MVMANNNLDDPLDNAQQLADQMESLPFIFRFDYENMSSYFCSLMDPIITAYSQGLLPGMCTAAACCFWWALRKLAFQVQHDLRVCTTVSQELMSSEACAILIFACSAWDAQKA